MLRKCDSKISKTTKIIDFTGDGFYDSNEPFEYAVLSSDPQQELPTRFTICSTMFYGGNFVTGDYLLGFFVIYQDKKIWPWVFPYDESMMGMKYVYDDMGFLTHIFVNGYYQLDNPRLKPLKLNTWQPLCTAIDANSGELKVVR